jgi:FkbM family methyltransferase
MNATQLITAVGRIPLLNQAVRWCANQYPENSVAKIKYGQAAGSLWRRHHRYVNGYWIGHYELPMQNVLARELKMGQTFFDIGANAGFFTLVAARLVGASGRCVAFEPSPENCASIREQIEANSLHHCSLVSEAIADFDGMATFSFAAPGSPMGHLGDKRSGEQQRAVKVTTLDRACARFGQPDFIKMDIEGGEAKALQAATDTLRGIRPGWLIELHGPECESQVKAILHGADYGFFDLQGVALNPDQVLPNHFVALPLKAERV